MKSLIIPFLLMLITLTGCKNEKTKIADLPTKMQQVMAIHDEVMPKMGTIGKLVEELNSKIDTTEQGQKYQKALSDLQDAHSAMMDWMKGFGNRFDSEEILKGKPLSDQKKEWLKEEEEKVKVMRDKVYESIANAEKLLQQK
jgi:hypothetical protein